MQTRKLRGRSMKTIPANGSRIARNLSSGRKNLMRSSGCTACRGVAKPFSGDFLGSNLIWLCTEHKAVPKLLNRLSCTAQICRQIDNLPTSTSHSKIRRSRRSPTSCALFFPNWFARQNIFQTSWLIYMTTIYTPSYRPTCYFLQWNIWSSITSIPSSLLMPWMSALRNMKREASFVTFLGIWKDGPQVICMSCSQAGGKLTLSSLSTKCAQSGLSLSKEGASNLTFESSSVLSC